jgi:hypothetical protein
VTDYFTFPPKEGMLWIFPAHSAVKMAACKKHFLSENEMERILEECGSEGDEVV